MTQSLPPPAPDAFALTPLWINALWFKFEGGERYVGEILDVLDGDYGRYALFRVRPNNHSSLAQPPGALPALWPLSALRLELNQFYDAVDFFAASVPLETPPAAGTTAANRWPMSLVPLRWELDGYEPDLSPPPAEETSSWHATLTEWIRASAGCSDAGGRVVCSSCTGQNVARCANCQREVCSHQVFRDLGPLLCNACFSALWIRDYTGTGALVGLTNADQVRPTVCTYEHPWIPEQAYFHDTLHPDATQLVRDYCGDDWYDFYQCPNCEMMLFDRVTK